MRKAGTYILFILLFALLGFSREFLFVNINNQLYNLYYGEPSSLPQSLKTFSRMDYSSLYYSKYGLTVIYYLAYLITSFFAVKFICRNTKFSYWIIYIYVLLLVLSGISMAYNYFINHQLSGDEYTFSRWLMGIAQSPLVVFFLIASNSLYKKFNLTTN